MSYFARYSVHTHELYAAALRRWFGCCETNALDPVAGIRRAHIEHYIRHLHESRLRDSGVPLRNAQSLARHADPRTTGALRPARGNLVRYGVHFLTAYVAGV